MPGPKDAAATGKYFGFEIDGMQHAIVACKPGRMKVGFRKAAVQARKDGCLDFTASKPSYTPWTVEKYLKQGDTHLKDLFQSFAKGQRKTNPSDTGSLIYKTASGAEARRINFFGFTPLSYDSLPASAKSGQAAKEVLTFSVQRCEYE
jgi:hypothetical protein